MNALIILSLTFLLSLLLGAFTIPCVVRLSHELHLYDLPDSRKVHALPIPRLGGVIFLPVATIIIAIVLVLMLRIGITHEFLWSNVTIQHFLAYMAGAMMLYSVGIFDDLHGVSYRVKFCIQIMAAALLCVSGLWIADFSYIFFIEEVPWWIGMPVTVLFVVYLTNAMNLIDGIDGLASGLSIISLSVIAGLNYFASDITWTMIPLAFVGVLLPFFYYNVFGNKNKTFMGDAGSLTLGFTLAFLVLHFWQREPVWNRHIHNIGIIALSTLIIPMFDVVRVFMSRVRDGRNPFLPDKNHIHHKLLRTGMNPKMAMATLLTISVIFVIINYLVASQLSQTLMIVGDVVIFCLMHVVINHFISKKEDGKTQYDRAY
ncbi:MAG: undecaprenyl/decaprenyl-phosphate alpha-N-acetylglucosaminyl 1-phosphate transferase [Prevotella sp.]|nr:undecaprenyl/decaprenyl-phosphate alpha-N-acetylglucosaminyl 1-phosphate transferase [Prevotella sp.]MBR1839708.1 undecaprenyl/decaprenyl-phosphate alpha-N-acetylglucosaminyl 1-phosphate transferase [Prevotella sp.]